MGIGDWGLGIGPNPQSPIPNPQLISIQNLINNLNYLKLKNYINNYNILTNNFSIITEI